MEGGAPVGNGGVIDRRLLGNIKVGLMGEDEAVMEEIRIGGRAGGKGDRGRLAPGMSGVPPSSRTHLGG